MEKYYTIKDVATRTGMSPHTLRYYDKKGLLSFIKRSESGIRLFTEEDFESLYTIHCLKETGMPLAKIKEFMDLYRKGNDTINDRRIMFEQQRQNVLDEIDKLNKMLKVIEYKCWFFKEAEKYHDVYFYKKMDKKDYPPQMKAFFEDVHDFSNVSEENDEY